MKKIGYLLLIALFPAHILLAYGPDGHRAIASIAQSELSVGARKKIDKLLGTNGMIYTSTWADEVRSEPSYSYSYPWHYQNLKANCPPDELIKLWNNPTAEGEHLFFAIGQMLTRLKQNNQHAAALRSLIHLTGDLYQPMHLGREADQGGNRVGYTWFGQQSTIHRLWDSQLIGHHQMSYTELARYLADSFAPQKKELKKRSVTDDLLDSYQLCNRIYHYDHTDTNNYLYFYRFNADLNLQVYKAGLRLAQFLESIY
ncbi:MAG: S1/P1 nuclease [Paludibacter sp.]|nr:MAG: S1/P1 nuclease [Paludibacter sp.]